jgi:hypothetical protein
LLIIKTNKGKLGRLYAKENHMNKNGRYWPIGITIVFILFALYLIFFLYLTSGNRTDLVERDYYRKGIQYQQQIERVTRTRLVDEKPLWHYNQDSHHLAIQFADRYTSGAILLYRPSDASADRRFSISPDDSARQIIDLSLFKTGLWKLKIDWQVKNSSYYLEDILVIEKKE